MIPEKNILLCIFLEVVIIDVRALKRLLSHATRGNFKRKIIILGLFSVLSLDRKN